MSIHLLARPGTPRSPARGMLIYALALLLFAGMDSVSKYLAMRHPVPLVAWMRYAVHLLLMTAIFAPTMGRSLVVTHRTSLVMLRAACLVGITLFMMMALRKLPLAEATSIVFVAPLIVALLAKPILHERIGRLRGAAAVVGFMGVLLIVRPSGILDGMGIGLALFTALCMAAYQLLTRILSHTEHAVAMLYYSALAGTIVFGIFLPWFWFEQTPPLSELLLYCSLGTLGFVGHLCFTLAFRDAPASTLAPISYLQLLWAGLLGWLVFDQVPDGLALIGMLVIGVCGTVVAVAGRRSAKGPSTQR